PPPAQPSPSSDPLGDALEAARESRRQTPQRQLTQFWRHLRTEIRVGIVALIAGAVLGVPTWIIGGMPSAAEVWREIRDFMDPSAPGTRFTVLIADLANDDAGRTQTQQLFESFDGHRGLTVMRTAHALR